ncbi:UvrD-helicase domain-containing protein [Salisaeta longa]|uniref:UvrD-helicase domain-containing protein n=1 Tax=Salisaeta longa TaxID=503170 RepID=UPI0003B3BAF2|nr:UvrD-helicase domain-containing protein [Salisaeta longa]
MSTAPNASADHAARACIGPWQPDEPLPSLDSFEADTNFVVRAAAGSGKTTTLVARMVALLRTGAARPRDLAAITFTRKAAGEMKERFHAELRRTAEALTQRAHTSDAPTEELHRIRQAQAEAEQCFIGTLHAFYGRILRTYAFEAALPLDFMVGAEEDDLAPLRTATWQAYVQERAGDPLRVELEDTLGLPMERLESLYATFSAHPELTPYTNAPDAPPALDEAVDTARAFVERWQALRPDPPLGDRDRAQQALDRAEDMMRHLPLDTPAHQARFLQALCKGTKEKKGRVKLNRWGASGSEAYESARHLRDNAYPALYAAVQPPLTEWTAYAHRQAVAFVTPAAERYTARRRAEGLLTHHDVLYWTRELLRDHPDIRTAVHQRFPRLLVDEFQDTDPLQAEILFLLTSTDPTATDWRTCTPRPGSLFIVGDDKQSIYRFRRADITIFEAVTERMEATGGRVTSLRLNFRSRPEILQFCDDAFTELFAEHQDEGTDEETVQASYEPFAAHRPAGRTDACVRVLKTGAYGRNTDAFFADEAQQIARFIRAAVDRGTAHPMAGPQDAADVVFPGGAAYGDFMVLTRKKKRLSMYAKALAAHNIPFAITGSEDLGDGPAVQDLLAALRAAVRPDDAVAQLAYLRSGLVGCSDDDLYAYRVACDAADGAAFDALSGARQAAVRDALPSDTARRLAGAAERLADVRTLLQSKRPALALHDVVERLGLLPAVATPSDPSGRALQAGRLLTALDLLQRHAGEGAHWSDLVNVLHDIVHGEEPEDSRTLHSGSPQAVRIMNVHQAKGLEAPVVFLAGPKGRSHGQATQHVYRPADGPARLVAPLMQQGSYRATATHAPRGWNDVFAPLEDAHQAAEEHRLRYVAATRAENLLVIAYGPKKDGDPCASTWQPLHAYTEAIDAPRLRTGAPADGEAAPADPPPMPHVHAPPPADGGGDRPDALTRPTFATATVSGGKHNATPLRWTSGYGAAYGTVIHDALERWVQARADDPRPPAVAVLQERLAAVNARLEAPDPSLDAAALARRAHTTLERFRQTPLAAQIRDADVAYAEYPFVTCTPDAEGTPVVMRGVIDLLYRDADGWHIVDYKTDRLPNDATLPYVPDDHPYVQQVRQYARYWNAQPDARVASAGLWFTDTETLQPIDLSA